MATRPRVPADAENEQAQLPITQLVTYLPGPDDPVKTKWHGIVFDANVPKEVTKPELIEAARTNPHFKVGEFNPARDKAPAPGFKGTPSNPEEYRAHFANWLNKIKIANAEGEPNINALDDLIKTWISETHLRDLVGVGSDDYALIGSLFLPKMGELQKAMGLTDDQLVQKWKDYGVFALPF